MSSPSRAHGSPSSTGILALLLMRAPGWVAPLAAAAAAVAVTAACTTVLHFRTPTALTFGLGAAVLVLLTRLSVLPERARRRRALEQTRTLDDLRVLSWQQFEALVADAYRGRGWAVIEVGAQSRGGADGGIDLLLRRTGEVAAVQCKRWRTRVVGVDKVRELRGALGDCSASRGIFVTSGRYTPDAIAFGRRNGVELVDGAGLLRLLPAGAADAPRRQVA